MKITENRESSNPPPVTSYTLELTPDQMRMLRMFARAATADAVLVVAGAHRAAESFLKATDNLEAANLVLNKNTRF